MPFNIGLPLIWLANEVLFLLRVCNRLSQPMYVLPYLLYINIWLPPLSLTSHKLKTCVFYVPSYKRVGYNHAQAKQFDDKTVYDMYIDGDFDRLVEYYSLRFNSVDIQ